MTELQTSQAPADILDWTYDFTKELATGVTIASATVTTDAAGAVTSNVTPATSVVTVRLACATVPLGTLVAMTCTAVLSTGEHQSKTHKITIEQT